MLICFCCTINMCQSNVTTKVEEAVPFVLNKMISAKENVQDRMVNLELQIVCKSLISWYYLVNKLKSKARKCKSEIAWVFSRQEEMVQMINSSQVFLPYNYLFQVYQVKWLKCSIPPLRVPSHFKGHLYQSPKLYSSLYITNSWIWS